MRYIFRGQSCVPGDAGKGVVTVAKHGPLHTATLYHPSQVVQGSNLSSTPRKASLFRSYCGKCGSVTGKNVALRLDLCTVCATRREVEIIPEVSTVCSSSGYGWLCLAAD